MALVGLPSIPTIILSQWGRTVPIQEKLVDRYIKEFDGGCPDRVRLDRIIRARNNTIKTLENLIDFIDQLDDIIVVIDGLITAIKAGITTLLLLPTSAQFASVGSILTLSDTLDSLKEEIGKYNQTVDNIRDVLEIIQETSGIVVDKLRSLDDKIADCGKEISSADLKGLIDSERTTQRQLDQAIYYNNYRIEIRTDNDNSLNVPLRYAVAINQLGGIVVRGESSYSSDTQVLIDEVKFKIDSL